MKATGIERANTATGEADMSISHRCTSAGMGGLEQPGTAGPPVQQDLQGADDAEVHREITTDSGLEKYSPSVPTANGRKATKAR